MAGFSFVAGGELVVARAVSCKQVDIQQVDQHVEKQHSAKSGAQSSSEDHTMKTCGVYKAAFVACFSVTFLFGHQVFAIQHFTLGPDGPPTYDFAEWGAALQRVTSGVAEEPTDLAVFPGVYTRTTGTLHDSFADVCIRAVTGTPGSLATYQPVYDGAVVVEYNSPVIGHPETIRMREDHYNSSGYSTLEFHGIKFANGDQFQLSLAGCEISFFDCMFVNNANGDPNSPMIEYTHWFDDNTPILFDNCLFSTMTS